MRIVLTEVFRQIGDYLWVFFISMVPVIELRGAIPIGVFSLDLPLIPTYIVAILGNILPVPFLILFSKRVLTWLTGFKKIGPIFQRIIDSGQRKAEKLGKYELFGLLVFVAIPLPGTGAWTGSLIAALLQLRVKSSFFAISAGVVIAGIIMSLASAGLLGALSKWFAI